MSKAEKYSSRLTIIRWLCFAPALVIFAALRGPFGTLLSAAAGLCFGAAFFAICSRGSRRIICEEIVADLTEAISKLGHREILFEVRKFTPGLVVRIYLVRARQLTPACVKLIRARIKNCWYRRYVIATQVTDVNGLEDVEKARRRLNRELLEDLTQKLKKENKDEEGDKR